MNNNNQVKQPNVYLKNTTAVTSSSGNQIFAEGILLRKISKFLIGQDKDGIIPIPCFYDVKTGAIMLDTLPDKLPKEVREEYVKYNENLLKNK